MRHYFIKKFGIDPPIINGDQIPLHRNEPNGQATFNFKNHEAFVKENHHLSRERVTIFTQIASNENVSLSHNIHLKALANVQRSSRHLQEHNINGLIKVHTI